MSNTRVFHNARYFSRYCAPCNKVHQAYAPTFEAAKEKVLEEMEECRVKYAPAFLTPDPKGENQACHLPH